jgi:hypothetical protein
LVYSSINVYDLPSNSGLLSLHCCQHRHQQYVVFGCVWLCAVGRAATAYNLTGDPELELPFLVSLAPCPSFFTCAHSPYCSWDNTPWPNYIVNNNHWTCSQTLGTQTPKTAKVPSTDIWTLPELVTKGTDLTGTQVVVTSVQIALVSHTKSTVASHAK